MKTFRKLAMMAVAIFAAISFTSCDDNDEPVVNSTLDGTWKIISGATTGQGNFDLIPDGFAKNPQTETADEHIYPISLEFKTDGTGVYTFQVTEYEIVKNDEGKDVVKSIFVDKTSAFTYTTSEITPAGVVKNELPQMTINYAASPYFESATETPSYRIEGDVLYLYQDFPRAADVLRKK